jgi:SAM-dependent methyltransferase
VSIKKLGATTFEGVDFNVRAVALARQKGISVFQGLFVAYPGELLSYDAIFMNHYIEHVLDPVAELEKAKALLQSGGILFGEAPNFGSIDRKIFGRYWGGNHVPRHTFQFEPDRLNQLLCDAGFKSVVITSELNSGMVSKSIQNYLQRNVKTLRNIPRLKYGRIKQFDLLLLAAIPLNIVFKLNGKSGVMKFTAVA